MKMNSTSLSPRSYPNKCKDRTFALTAGVSYWLIFILAIFANFFVLESLTAEPVMTIQEHPSLVRIGILAFLLTVVFDVVVAWSIYMLYQHHPLSTLSLLFRMMHAGVMAVAIFALPDVLFMNNSEDILNQVNTFNTIWLLGLFFFGIHIVLLATIISPPTFIKVFLIIAGASYMVDTVAHFTFAHYQEYAELFLILVAVPSVLGEMSLALWLLVRAGKGTQSDEHGLHLDMRYK